MKRVTTIIATLAISFSAYASPQGSWPEDMRGYSLPRQPWIMIIPATRNPDGSVSVWNRADAWNREWTVPKATPGGTRTVAVNGDSEDMRIVSPAQIDNMSVSSLSRLAGKYGAQAIAVVVAEEAGDVAVAAWAKGNFATWDTAFAEGEGRREAALAVLDEIFSGNQDSGRPAGDGQARDSVSVTGQRFNDAVGRMEYRITGTHAVLDTISRDPSFEITARNDDVPPSVDLVVVDGRDIGQALREGGYPLR